MTFLFHFTYPLLGECLLWWPALTRLHLQHTLISDAVMVSFEHLAALKVRCHVDTVYDADSV